MSAGTGLDNVGINNDVGNWLIINEDPVLASKKVLPYTFHSHIRDYVLEGGTYDGVAVGDGLVDFEAALPGRGEGGGERRPVHLLDRGRHRRSGGGRVLPPKLRVREGLARQERPPEERSALWRLSGGLPRGRNGAGVWEQSA